MKVALYARVSTSDQTCELQLKELREFCERKQWEVVLEYVDVGWSGARVSRPRLDALKEHARQGRFQAVLVWKLDRWGRSLPDCISSIQELSFSGIRFLSITQNIDTDESNPMSRLMLHLLAAFAEFERELAKERSAAGIKRAKERGVKFGRRRAVFDRSKALDLKREGKSMREIAGELGASKDTVSRFLRGMW